MLMCSKLFLRGHARNPLSSRNTFSESFACGKWCEAKIMEVSVGKDVSLFVLWPATGFSAFYFIFFLPPKPRLKNARVLCGRKK